MEPRRLDPDQPAPGDLMDQLARLEDCSRCGCCYDPHRPPTCDDGHPCQA